MRRTKSSIIDIKSKDAIKLDIVKLYKTYPEENVLLEVSLQRYPHQSGEQHGDQKR